MRGLWRVNGRKVLANYNNTSKNYDLPLIFVWAPEAADCETCKRQNTVPTPSRDLQERFGTQFGRFDRTTDVFVLSL